MNKEDTLAFLTDEKTKHIFNVLYPGKVDENIKRYQGIVQKFGQVFGEVLQGVQRLAGTILTIIMGRYWQAALI